MKQTASIWVWWIRALAYTMAAAMLVGGLLSLVITEAADPQTPQPAWTSPSAMAIKRVSPVGSAQNQPNLFSNLDCSLVTYRLAATSTMQTGCFTATAFGLLDSDSGIVIFNGTDEGLPLLPYSPHQVLAPWPGAGNLVVLDAVSTGGSYISLYKGPVSLMQDQRNLLFQLKAKQLTAPPELLLTDTTGQRLVINSQSMAFSDSGSWLVAETLNGSFVRINLATLDMTAFAPAFGAQGSPALLKSKVTISSDGRYVAIANEVAASFKVYDLVGCTGPVVNLQPRSCPAYNYWSFAGQKISSLQSVRHLRFVNDGLLSFEAVSTNPAAAGIYLLAPTATITSLIDYLGLGDSYTSGEGAFNYIADTDTPDNMCHLSARSYPLLLTHDLYSQLGGHSVACSGAVINDVGSIRGDYRGQVREVPSWEQLRQTQPALLTAILTNFVPGYIAQHRFVGHYQPAVVTVSVGGDDIGFGGIVERCVAPHVSLHRSDNDCYNTYESRLEVLSLIDRTVPRLTALYKQLQAAAPASRLYAIGYPIVTDNTGNCASNVHLSKSELEFAQELVIYLNDSIRHAASKAGVTYIDISQALYGHRLCETASHNVAVNGLTAGTDGGLLGIRVFGKESYHPNALGHELIKQAILRQTTNLTLRPVAAATPTDSQRLLKAPKTGRAINALVPDSKLAAPVIKKAKSTVIKAAGARNGLKPRTAYNVRLDGPGGMPVGSGNSNDSGDLETTIILPENTVPGSHTINVTGENQAGEHVDVWQPIYVPAGDADSDGDGIDNTIDSCPIALNSGQDQDRDGTDDSCDAFIGLPPSPDNNSSSLNPPHVTIVTTFTGDTGQTSSPIAVQPSITSPIASRNRVLGTQTFRPAKTNDQILKMSSPPGKTDKITVLWQRPRLIDWLPWVILAGLAWLLLLLLILLLNRSRKRERRIAYI